MKIFRLEYLLLCLRILDHVDTDNSCSEGVKKREKVGNENLYVHCKVADVTAVFFIFAVFIHQIYLL